MTDWEPRPARTRLTGVDYCLDAGDGTASIWSGRPAVDVDADGVLDGVRVDLDGDGLVDDALADLDGDGLAEHAAFDIEGDAATALHTDDGTGTWTLVWGLPAAPLRWFGLDGVERTADGTVDLDGDGRPDRLYDTDRDGLADRVLRSGPDGELSTGYVDTDGDGRWDLMLTDADSDGTADAASPL